MNDPIKLPDQEYLSNATASFGVSLAITSVASALLVVAKEKAPAIMSSMKSATGHHWATHSLFALLLFFALGAGLMRVRSGQGLRMTAAALIKTVIGGVAAGSVIIAGFYLFLD